MFGNIILIIGLVMIVFGSGLVPLSVTGASQDPVVCNAGFYSKVIGISETKAKVQFGCFHKVQSSYDFTSGGQTHMIPAASSSHYSNVEVRISKDYTEGQYNSYKASLYVDLGVSPKLITDTYTFSGQDWKIAKGAGLSFDAETLMDNVNSYTDYAKDIDNTCTFGNTVTCDGNTYKSGEDIIFFVDEAEVSITEGSYKRAFLFYPAWFATYPNYNKDFPNEFLTNFWGYWDYLSYEYIPGQDPNPPEDIKVGAIFVPFIVGGFVLGGLGVFLRRRRR